MNQINYISIMNINKPGTDTITNGNAQKHHMAKAPSELFLPAAAAAAAAAAPALLGLA